MHNLYYKNLFIRPIQLAFCTSIVVRFLTKMLLFKYTLDKIIHLLRNQTSSVPWPCFTLAIYKQLGMQLYECICIGMRSSSTLKKQNNQDYGTTKFYNNKYNDYTGFKIIYNICVGVLLFRSLNFKPCVPYYVSNNQNSD